MADVIALITTTASVITATGVILGGTKKGRDLLFKPITERLDALELNMLRLRIINLINDYPEQSTMIHKLYTRYLKHGGNSEMKIIYEKWCEEYQGIKRK